jgi:hypothetical protein
MNHFLPIMAKLNEAKANSNLTAAFLADSCDPRKQKQAERMVMCASGIGINADKRYVYGRGCGLPHCQVCVWRKSRVLMAQIARVGQIAGEAYPDCVWFFVVLTVPNCRLTDLHATMDDFNNAFTRMTRTQGWSAIGTLKVFEFPSADTGWGDQQVHRVNLHANLLVLVPCDKADAFAANIGTMWAKANKADYLSASCDPITQNGLVPAMGYSSKPTPVSYDADYAIALAEQLHGAHRIQACGAVKAMFADVKVEWEARKPPGGWRPPQGDVTWLEWNSRADEYYPQEGELAHAPECSEAATSAAESGAINCTDGYGDSQTDGLTSGMIEHGEQVETGESDCQPAHIHGEGYPGDADGIEGDGCPHGHDLLVDLRGSPPLLSGFLSCTSPPIPGTAGVGAHSVQG